MRKSIEHRWMPMHSVFVSAQLLAAASSGCASDGIDEPEAVAGLPQAARTQAPVESSRGARSKDPSLVTTTSGTVRGLAESSYRMFLGIPYAAAPVGELRWKPPAPPPSWTGVRAATAAGSVCPQVTYGMGGVATIEGDEDCLVLNVTTPNRPNMRKLPVMVWVHGGEYVSGSNLEQDTLLLAQKGDVVVVSINYRLGALGFLAHPALSAESLDSSGNFGLLDQQAALRWVKANIAQFGGDPSNVTIFGVSSGGNSVWAHVISPKSSGLFQRAISISGLWATCWNWMGYDEPAQPFSLSDAESTGVRFAEAVGCSGSEASAAACLRSVSLSDLVQTGGGGFGPAFYRWGPAAGGAVMPKQLEEALAAGEFNRVPIVNGSTHDEAMPFVMMPFWVYTQNPLTPEVYGEVLAQRFGEDAALVQTHYSVEAYGAAAYAYSAVDTDLQNACYTRSIDRLAAAYTSVYAYEFRDPNPPDPFYEMVFGGPLPYSPRAYHASDVQYIFRSPSNATGLSPAQLELSDRMIEYYVDFARFGAPLGHPLWLPYGPSSDAVLSLAPDAIEPVTDFASDHQCAFWAELRGI
jgi:para-nitrobenzyl esterase